MPGGGKSTIGRQLARKLDRPYTDTDAVIERRIGGTIRDYFEREGEPAFRDLEAKVLAELIETGAGVLATGGGIVLRAANREALSTRTVCVYLHATPEELHRRLRHDTRRPLLQVGDPLARLRELHEQRDALYRAAARFVVETGRPTLPTLVNMIVMQLDLAGTESPDAPAASGEDLPPPT